ncbi:hypothetical protein ACIBF6_02245 [Streptosporangium amethystogenes]|uniref:hypothetical protein n=1 Tax=Streptosporangium amethystogenes TaxID=2002 RepID=UPI0037BD463B
MTTASGGPHLDRRPSTPGPALGTVAFLNGGEYFGLEVRPGSDPSSLTLAGMATSFVHTRPYRLELTGSLIGSCLDHAGALAAALGRVWELDGRVSGRPVFPFLECEAVPVPGGNAPVSGAVIRIMSEYGEQHCLYAAGCRDAETTAVLAACAVLALSLPPSVWNPGDTGAGLPAGGHGEINVLGEPGCRVSGELKALPA